MKLRLIIMSMLQFAIWGAYLSSVGAYMAKNGQAAHIGLLFSSQGIVSIFMPALMGVVADKWIQAQKLYSICHAISSSIFISLGIYGIQNAGHLDISVIYPLYFAGIGFYMPTLALSNSVAYHALEGSGLDTVSTFPKIRTFGTIGFILSMWATDLLGYQQEPHQFIASGVLGWILSIYALTLPACSLGSADPKQRSSFAQKIGLNAFKLFKVRHMAVFFVFAALLGVCNQITNAFANPFINSFGRIPEFADTFGVKHTNILISASQICEAACILLIPFFFKRFGIKVVLTVAMVAWSVRFAMLAAGDPGQGVWIFLLGSVAYGIAFDFFSISGSIFVNSEAPKEIKSSAQGLMMLMTNGIGITIGSIAAQKIINLLVYSKEGAMAQWDGWQTAWLVFAAYALILAVAFALIFHKKESKTEN